MLVVRRELRVRGLVVGRVRRDATVSHEVNGLKLLLDAFSQGKGVDGLAEVFKLVDFEGIGLEAM